MKIIGKEIIADPKCFIHRKGSNAYGSRILLFPNDTLEDFEEVDTIPEENSEDYKSLVIDLIRERYDVNDEIAIIRQKDTKPNEYKEWSDYCEECKKKAKSSL